MSYIWRCNDSSFNFYDVGNLIYWTSLTFILSLRLQSVMTGGFDFSHPCEGPRNLHPSFKQPLVDTVWHVWPHFLHKTVCENRSIGLAVTDIL
jgi:hypothetical protein